MRKVMYLDCFSGAAGDMLLGALIDAGLPTDSLRDALGSLGVDHEITVTRVLRAGISAVKFDVRERHDGPDEPHHQERHHHHHDHGHGQEHLHHGHGHGPGRAHHHDHRSLAEIERLIDVSALPPSAKVRVRRLFGRLASAEAAIHDMPIDRVHLHEVGAVDSIIDIAGLVYALEWFGIDDIVASPLNVGSGTVAMAHGAFPVPAPATARLLTGVPVYSSGLQAELVTPTGALVVSDYATAYGPVPPMRIERIGYGAGTRDLAPVPNVLRVLIGERLDATARPDGGAADIMQIECEIDDMNPQLYGPLTERLFAAGAADVFLTPIQMKKGRPGTLLTVLAVPDARATLTEIIFRETTTLGVRFAAMQRETLDRRWEAVAVSGGEVRIKIAARHGEVLGATPEFEDCRRVASATGRPVRAVQAEALAAWTGSAPGRSGERLR